MNTPAPSIPSSSRVSPLLALDPAERRRLGLYGPGEARLVEKNGIPIASLGAIQSQWIEVSPELAKRWLKNNFGNRPVRMDVVRAYARDMRNRQWVSTHQGIAFNISDELVDGQHRLLAIVMSGVTVRTMVTFGLPTQVDGTELTSMDCVDRGAPRSVGDQLTIQHGMKNGGIIASICAGLANLCHGERTRRLSVGKTLAVYRTFEPAVNYAVVHRPKTIGLRATGVHAGFAFALMAELRAGAPGDFWDSHTPTSDLYARVMTGQGLQDKSPGRLLRDFITSEEAKLFTRSLDRGLAELTLQAIYLEHHNRTVPKLEMSLDGVNYFRGLQAERVRTVAAMFKLPNAEKAAPQAEQTAEGKHLPKRPILEQIMALVEHRFKLSRIIIAGKGTDPDVAWPRTAFVSLALSYGYPPCAIGQLIHRTDEAVLAIHIPRKHMSAAQTKILDALKAKLGN